MSNTLKVGNQNAQVDSFVNGDGWLVERASFAVRGHDVQIMRYNGDDSAIVVKVDGDAVQMPLSRADQFIRNRI